MLLGDTHEDTKPRLRLLLIVTHNQNSMALLALAKAGVMGDVGNLNFPNHSFN